MREVSGELGSEGRRRNFAGHGRRRHTDKRRLRFPPTVLLNQPNELERRRPNAREPTKNSSRAFDKKGN